MSVHDPSAGMSYGWDRRIRWPRIRPGLGRLRPKGSRPDARVRVRYRKLAAIERALVADAPALSAKFALFNHVTKGERPVGPEQVSTPSRPRPQPVLAVLLALAAVAALCLTLSAQIHTVVRPCAVTAVAGAPAYAPVRGLDCRAYANTKQ